MHHRISTVLKSSDYGFVPTLSLVERLLSDHGRFMATLGQLTANILILRHQRGEKIRGVLQVGACCAYSCEEYDLGVESAICIAEREESNIPQCTQHSHFFECA